MPDDNPFSGKAGYKPEIYTLGHRSTLALAVHPGTGELWENENGPNGGDEINVLEPGANYGWPLVSSGRTYPGPWQSKGFSREGFEDPIVYWTPAIAVSGMAFYTGSKLAKWTGDVFVGGMRMGEIPARGICSASCSTRTWKSCAARCCSSICASVSATCGKGPTSFSISCTDEDDGRFCASSRQLRRPCDDLTRGCVSAPT